MSRLHSILALLGLCHLVVPEVAVHAGDSDQPLQRFEVSQPHMGTRFTFTFYTRDPQVARQALGEVFTRLTQLNARFSDYHENSEINRLVRREVGKPVQVSEDLFRVLAYSQELQERSGGAFDIALGPLIHLWRDARKAGELPDAAAVAEARSRSGFDKLKLNDKERTMTLAAAGMQLDFGGIAKGYAADEALEILANHGIDRAMVAASGDIAVGAPPPGEEGWKIRALPGGETGEGAGSVLMLAHAAVSTSGDTEQFAVIDGVRYSHIVDPWTGVGLSERVGVSVVGPSAMVTDSVATAVSVMGAEEGLRLVEACEGVEALVVEAEDQVRRFHRSSDWPGI